MKENGAQWADRGRGLSGISSPEQAKRQHGPLPADFQAPSANQALGRLSSPVQGLQAPLNVLSLSTPMSAPLEPQDSV